MLGLTPLIYVTLAVVTVFQEVAMSTNTDTLKILIQLLKTLG
jgi:hypothetical protein